MNYEYIGKRNRIIWDGNDEGLSKINKVECPYCSSCEKYCIENVSDLETSPKDLLKYLIENDIVIESGFGFEIKEGVPGYMLNSKCSCCNEDFWLIIGVKEVQPQRFNVLLKSKIKVLK